MGISCGEFFEILVVSECGEIGLFVDYQEDEICKNETVAK
jgi:hypothetical protein